MVCQELATEVIETDLLLNRKIINSNNLKKIKFKLCLFIAFMKVLFIFIVLKVIYLKFYVCVFLCILTRLTVKMQFKVT